MILTPMQQKIINKMEEGWVLRYASWWREDKYWDGRWELKNLSSDKYLYRGKISYKTIQMLSDAGLIHKRTFYIISKKGRMEG